MAGMIRSIFGPTTEELRAKRLKRSQDLLESTFNTRNFEQRQTQQAGTLLGLGAAFLKNKYSGDPEMEKAQQAEAQQTALNERLANVDRPDDPRRFMILADAAKEVGDQEGYTKYINLAANYEQLAERRRQQYRDEQIKGADELSDELDMRDKGVALSTIFDKDISEEERNKALQNFYQVGGTANDLYAYQQIGENLSKGSQGITKRQEAITDKFVSGLTNAFDPIEYYQSFKSVYGDDFVVPESFLDQFKTDENNTNDNGGNGGNGDNTQKEGSAGELGISQFKLPKLNLPDYWEWYSSTGKKELEKPKDPNELGISQFKLPDLNFTTYKDLYKNTNGK